MIEILKEIMNIDKEGENKIDKEKLMELFKKVEEKSREEYKESEEEIKSNFEKILKNSFCVIASTNNGAIVVGGKTDIMTCIATLIQSLLDKNNFDMNDVECLFKTIKQVNSKKDDEEKLDEILSAMMGE